MKILIQIKMVIIRWFSLFIVAYCSKDLKTELIVKFLTELNSKSSILLLCWTKTEKTNLLKLIHSKTLSKTAFFPIEEHSILHLNGKLHEGIEFILDLDCPNAIKVMQEDSSHIKFRSIYNWLLIYNNSVLDRNIFNELRNVKFRLDSMVKLAIFDKQNLCRIFEIYKPGHDVKNKIKLINGSITHTYKNFYESRKNLTGVLIRTGNTYKYFFNTVEEIAREMRNLGNRTFEKFNFQLFLCLIKIHNFSFNTTLSNAYFGNTTAGIDAGIAKMVHEKTVDMSTAGGFLRIDRIDYYDFLVPVYKFETCFVFINPGRPKPGTEVLKPFTTKTWLIFILISTFIVTAINVACRIENKFLKAPQQYSLLTSMVVTISILAQQGSAIVPFRMAGRIIFLNLLIFSMMIYNYYTSSLVSSLLSTVPDPISTVKELYESKLKVAIEPRPYTITYIIQQKNDRYINLLNRSKIYENGVPNFMIPSEGIEKVKEATYAYHTDSTTAYSSLQNAEQELICDIAQINLIPTSDIGIVMQKYSEYSEIFTISLRKMQSSGIYQRERTIWIPKKPACLLTTRVKTVGLSELFLVYLILCGGIFAAIFILFLEIGFKRRNLFINILSSQTTTAKF